MVRRAQMSTIPKHRLDPAASAALGREIRRRRLALGLSQTQLGRPFTRGFVSAVEHGHCIPSLSALLLLAERLRVPAGELITAVNLESDGLYTRTREDDPSDAENARQEGSH